MLNNVCLRLLCDTSHQYSSMVQIQIGLPLMAEDFFVALIVTIIK